jgi:hypothetical protein
MCYRLSLSLCRCGGGVAVSGVSGAAVVGSGCTLWAVWAVWAVEAAPLAALQAFFTAANDHHGQRHNEATATKAPRLATVGKNTSNFTMIKRFRDFNHCPTTDSSKISSNRGWKKLNRIFPVIFRDVSCRAE